MPRFNKNSFSTHGGKFYKVNDNIKAPTLRVIDHEGNNLGIITREEALEKAKEANVDLVEVAAQASPPVARIVEFQKFRYEENKKEQAAKKNAKEVELKEIWLTPRIAEHDLQTRLRRAEEFLDDGDRIMFRVKFKGREMAHTEHGFALLTKIFQSLEGKITIAREPKLEGRSITAIINKSKGTGKPTTTGETAIAEKPDEVASPSVTE